MRRVVAVALAGMVALVVPGCSGQSAKPAARCTPPAGGRCAGPLPITQPLTVDPSGRRLSGIFLCGGTLTAQETSKAVTVTYHASAVGAGAMSCARVPLSVTLHAPLGSRDVLDGTSHQRLQVNGS